MAGRQVWNMRLCVLLTRQLCRMPILRAAELIVRAGGDAIQLREKDLADRELLGLARELRALTRDTQTTFIVNDRPDIAVLAEADGVHVGQDDLPPAEVRRIVGDTLIVGVSTHQIGEARAAVDAGADYIGVGPVFPTETKGYSEGVGTDYIRGAAAAVSVPLVAIGGITKERAADAIAAGAAGVAVCSAILGAEDIFAETKAFMDVLGPFRTSGP